MLACNQNSCQGGINCCVNINYYPGFYCKVTSQCYQQPLWQVIVIPSLLAGLALALTILIFCKLRGKKANKRNVTTYAFEQIRVKPQPFHIKHGTFNTLPQTPNNLNYISSPSPLKPSQTILSSVPPQSGIF